jgi:hypothetical protein
VVPAQSRKEKPGLSPPRGFSSAWEPGPIHLGIPTSLCRLLRGFASWPPFVGNEARINLMEERIKAANAHCEEKVKQLQKERDAMVADLKSGIAMVGKLMDFEQQQMGSVAPAETRGASPKLLLASG